MGRSPCCDESSGLKKGPWTPQEDHLLIKYIQKHGHGSWRALPKLAGLNRCGKSCRLRWINYLRPDIKRGKFSQDEEQIILHLHSILGNKWSAIASHLPGRTDNEIKNFWNTHLKKRLIQMGFDPKTHRPRTDIFSSLPHLVALGPNLKELIDHRQQDDQAMIRLQAEAIQIAKLRYLQFLLQPQPSFANSTTSTVTDMDAYNLLNSLAYTIKGCPILSSSLPQLDLPTLSSLQQGLNDSSNSVSFSHLPDLQVPESYQTTTLDKGMVHSDQFNSSNCSWLPTPSSTLSLPAAAPVTQTYSSINNMGDASSASSHRGEAPTSWPAELLIEDPLFHEIA